MTEAQQQQRYQVVERLASGGMAEVFLAESKGIEGFKKRVAIKRILPRIGEKKKFIKMFLDEARLSAHLSHSNVAQVFDIGVGDNVYFIVMEYVDGADLKAVIEYMKNTNKVFPVESACLIASKICEGLTYAHELQGPDGQPLKIVHRDMSPPNVLITKHGEVKIVDFGLAKATSQLEKSEPGIIKGKFSYLSPEAATGNDVDLRTDIFAVGIILWEMLAGRRLFLGDTDFATVKLVQSAQIPPIRTLNTSVPPELEPIIKRALARDPLARYPTARDLGRDLTKFLYTFGRPVSAYDIAELVRGAMALRKRLQPSNTSNIDRLIEEVLFEFTSLQDEKGDKAAAPAALEPARSGEFEDPANWMDEFNVAPSPSSGDEAKKLIPDVSLEGGLAALEETGKHTVSAAVAAAAKVRQARAKEGEKGDDAEKADKAADKADKPEKGGKIEKADKAPVTKSSASATSTASPLAPANPPAQSGGALKVILLVAALALLAAGAWFGGLIPH